MSPPEPWSSARGWREFLDLLSDAVVVFDSGARVVFANTAALRLLPCESGMPVEQLQRSLGSVAVRWLKDAAADPGNPGMPPAARLADGRGASLKWRRIDPLHGAVHLVADDMLAATADPARRMPLNMSADGSVETIAFLWTSPFPTLLQDADFRIADVNPAFLSFSGYAREQVVGLDPLELLPPADRSGVIATRERLRAGLQTLGPAMTSGRLLDASGRERHYREARRTLTGADGRPLYLGVLQDVTAEHVARERADRSLREIDDWFALSPFGMVLYDERGLLVHTNPAFEALTGALPVSLADAPADLRELLGWEGDLGVLAALGPDGKSAHRQTWVTPPGKPARLLRAVVRCYRAVEGQRRYMAVVEDRSAEEERDLAQTQIGALMDAAGVGLATFQESAGGAWQGRAIGPALDAVQPITAMPHMINREIVVPESLTEFERLQAALRRAERAEVRYAIRHPELGQRWLLTRVEPATLASGKRTTSVVTLDITDQQTAQLRTEQLLRELSTILESTSAGIAYLRGDVLVRCNRRFEAMLGFEPGSITGRTLGDMLARHGHAARITADVFSALGDGTFHETEFELKVAQEEGAAAATRWYSLSVRRTQTTPESLEAIAVLSDVTRLKAQQQEFETLARDRELMFSLSGVGIAFLREGRIQSANQALAELTGYTVDELARLSPEALFIDEGDFAKRWPHTQGALAQHGQWAGERQLRRSDGRALWVQVSKRLVAVDDPGGGIIASYVNVDARYRAERAVALQAERTRTVLDSVLVGIVTVGPHGIEWMNRSARRMFGAGLAEFVDRPIATVATPEPDHPFRRTEYLTELVAGQAETFECRVMARDGREFWVVGNVVSTERESTGRQLTYALLDIERRREAEARMSQAQSQLQRIIEAAPLAITLRDARTLKVLQINAVAAANVRAQPAALIGRTPEQIFAPEVAAQHRRDMEQALSSSEVTQREYRDDHGGAPRVWDARYLPLAGVAGSPPDQLLLVATDVTEQRVAQEARFEAAIAQREMLVKEVHHRIKNNLQGVAGLLQQIAQRKPEVAGPIAEVVSQVQAIAHVYGLQVGEDGPLPLISVVKAITASVQRTFGRPIRFVTTGPEPARWQLPEAESIPTALTLNELLTNAVKHISGEAEVVCTLLSDAADVRVTIVNPGALPAGFDLGRIPGGISGLGLVRALLPRRSAHLSLEQSGQDVVATVVLRPPGVLRAA